MPIIRWEPVWADPFQAMERMLEGANVFGVRGFTPAVDVYQTSDAVVVETPLAGVDPKDVVISVENDVLTIRGQKRSHSEVEEKNYYRQEVRTGSFYRSIALPTRVLGDQATAQSQAGMLKITLPKAPGAKPKTIKVAVKP